uniref:CDV3 homolog n=1 Tax=Suricata suricatta TaxID=37032 RepID=A0A673TW31_SURSU
MATSEKEEKDNEKREDPGDNWEEGGGGVDGGEKSSGPWNKTAPGPGTSCCSNCYRTPEPAMTSGVYRPPEATMRKTPQGPPESCSDTQSPIPFWSAVKHELLCSDNLCMAVIL